MMESKGSDRRNPTDVEQTESENVRLFKEEVLNVWNQAQKEARDDQARLTWRLKGIQKKKDRLVEAHRFRRARLLW